MELEILNKDKYYHIFNRGINKENIFIESENKRYFINLFQKHLNGKCSMLAYCLMDNHFHFLVYAISEGKELTQALSNLFNAYSKAFNKYSNRSGSLFEKHFKRIEIQSEEYLRNLVIYIHRNPTSHFNIPYQTYNFSSFKDRDNAETEEMKSYVFSFFDSRDNFQFLHESQPNIYNQFLLE